MNLPVVRWIQISPWTQGEGDYMQFRIHTDEAPDLDGDWSLVGVGSEKGEDESMVVCGRLIALNAPANLD